MRFSRVRLENWRNFGHVDVALQARAFLVGPNASGKSNFLDAIRFLRDLVAAGGGFQRSVADRGGVTRIRNLAARRNPNVAVDVTLGEGNQLPWRYRLTFAQDNQRQPLVREEKVWHGWDLILARPNAEDELDAARLRQTYLEQTIANAPFRAIADCLSTVRYHHIVPQLVRDPGRGPDRPAEPFGTDFLERMAGTNKRTLNARLRRILEALRAAVPQLRELKLERDERGVPHLYGNYEHWRPKGAWQSEADFSDGTLRLIGLLWALLEGSGPLLLEEPELSLHPEIVRHIPQMMLGVRRRRSGETRQTLMSTHSSDLLSDAGIAADEILLVIPAQEGSQVQVGAEMQEVREILDSGLTAAEAVLTGTSLPHADQLPLFGA